MCVCVCLSLSVCMCVLCVLCGTDLDSVDFLGERIELVVLIPPTYSEPETMGRYHKDETMTATSTVE